MKAVSFCRRLAVLLLMLLSPLHGSAAEVHTRHYDGVLGTSLDMTVHGADADAAALAFDAAVAEIARLERLLSGYREDSELSRLNRQASVTNASAELLDIVELCQQWWERSARKFSCRLGTVLALWEQAEREQRVPERPDIRHTARAAINAEVNTDRERGMIALGAGLVLDPSGLAKGYIIDRALERLAESLPEAVALKVDIGGDARYQGVPPESGSWTVAVADPVHTADNSGYLATLKLDSMAVAASGHHSRTREIGRRSFSHILQPRDGWPVEHGTASVVLAQDATTADAVATALAVLPLIDGVDWVNSLDGVEALVIDAAGRRMSTEGWSRFTEVDSTGEGKGTGSGAVMELAFTLPDPAVSSYNRPYVAIWITDPDNKALKNLLLLGETERWARENSRWWRRVGRRNPELLDGVARPTRGPGEYQLAWDGLDDFGQPAGPGEYILHLEASREGGGSNYQQVPFSAGKTAELALEPDGEFGAIRISVH